MSVPPVPVFHQGGAGGAGGSGDVAGPSSSTDNALARFDATTGKLLQNGLVTESDAGAVAGVTQLDVDNIRIDGQEVFSIASFIQIRSASGQAIFLDAGGGGSDWQIDAANGIFAAGTNSGRVKVQGNAKLKGSTSTAAAATTSEYATDEWGFHKNTATGALHLCYNDGGTIKSVQLS